MIVLGLTQKGNSLKSHYDSYFLQVFLGLTQKGNSLKSNYDSYFLQV